MSCTVEVILNLRPEVLSATTSPPPTRTSTQETLRRLRSSKVRWMKLAMAASILGKSSTVVPTMLM